MILVDERPVPGPRGRMWHHMATDNLSEDGLEELHSMADALGLRREWLHRRPHLPHYDVPPEIKAAAMALGAQEVPARELVRRCRRKPA